MSKFIGPIQAIFFFILLKKFVKTTGIPEASFLYDTGDIFLLCYKKQIGLQFKFVLLAQI